jgi:hypothetical protein
VYLNALLDSSFVCRFFGTAEHLTERDGGAVHSSVEAMRPKQS